MPREPNNTPIAGPGHNSLAIDRDRLRSLIERIENLEGERASLAEDVRDVYREAKGQGYDVAALRQVIKLRKQDKAERDERQSIIDAYLHALGDLADLPLGRAAMQRAGLAPPV